MRKGKGLAVFLFLSLWVAMMTTQAAAGTAVSGSTPGVQSASAALPTYGGSCTADSGGECKTGERAAHEEGAPSLDLIAFYAAYEARRSSHGVESARPAADSPVLVAAQGSAGEAEGTQAEESSFEEMSGPVSDPLEPLNRAFFHFNDKLYFWFLKPAAQGYKVVVPEPARVGVRNFFTNLTGPARMINCLLQGKTEEAGYEFVRFFVNSTLGLAGLVDVASFESVNVKKYDEDLGQTLGVYGWEHSIFINWPFLGPSCGRDTLGLLGDSFLDPVNYLVPRTKYNLGVKGYNRVNETSLSIGDYEDLKRSALDPYVALRDAYYQYRNKEIEE